MKKLHRLLLLAGIVFCCVQEASAQQGQYTQQPGQQTRPSSGFSGKIGFVNTKKCLEESKLGKQEQVNFEKMKQQMESILQDKEKTLEDIEGKLNDEDYMDSISDEAAAELKRKRKTIRQEGYQLQSQYMQTLQHANVKIVQKITESITKASEQLAQDMNSSGQSLDAILSNEAATYHNPQLDLTDKIIARMNTIFDAEQRESQPKPR